MRPQPDTEGIKISLFRFVRYVETVCQNFYDDCDMMISLMLPVYYISSRPMRKKACQLVFLYSHVLEGNTHWVGRRI
jgi:hypothetical protein